MHIQVKLYNKDLQYMRRLDKIFQWEEKIIIHQSSLGFIKMKNIYYISKTYKEFIMIVLAKFERLTAMQETAYFNVFFMINLLKMSCHYHKERLVLINRSFSLINLY